MEQQADDQPVEELSTGSRGGFGSKLFILIAAGVAITVSAFLAILVWASVTSDPARGGLAVNDRIVELNVGGEAAPEFNLALIGGGNLDTSDLRGQVVMLDFWASWCPPCRDEAPVLAQVYGEYRDRGVEFVGLDLWDNAGDAELFLQQQGHEYPNGIDHDGRIAISYGVRGIPEKFFLDREGRIARKFSGPMTADLLRQILDTLLLQ